MADKAKHAAKSARLHYAFGKDAVKQNAQKAKKSVQQTASNAAQKAKTTAQNTAHRMKVRGRHARIVTNTKIAPKLIKGAGRVAGPVAAIAGVLEVRHAYKKGGANAAAKQAVKTGGGMAVGWAGMKAGAAIGTAVGGPIGTVVGGVIGGVAGYFTGEKIFSL